MTNKFGPELELPPEMRALAEKNVAQARQAFETLFSSAREAVGDTEGRFEDVRAGMRDLRQKTLGLVESNVAASFDFLHKLVSAKSPQEMMGIQAEFLQNQLQAMAQQAQTLTADARSLGETTVKSLDQHARALAERVQALSATAAQNAQAAAADMKNMGESALRGMQANAEKMVNEADKTFNRNS